MWSANRFANEARRFERAGRAADARASWAQAAVKAESVVTRAPHGRYADDALVLQGEGLAKSGACDRAAAPLTRALRSVKDSALLNRAALVAAECAIRDHNPATAERLLQPLTQPPDRREAARATYLLGQAAEQRGAFVTAAAWYARSREKDAAPARARALLYAGSTSEALALIDSLTGRGFDEAAWDSLLADIGRTTGAEAASAAVDRVLGHGRWRNGPRARLLLDDGDRLFVAGALEAAHRRYGEVAAAAPDSMEGHQARVRQVRVDVARATSMADLTPLRQQLSQLLDAGLSATAASDARVLNVQLRSLADPERDTAEAAAFRAAEFARDSLRAPTLAANLFLAFATAHPRSLFAPKALVAAADLSPESRDSLLAVLHQDYSGSPYTLALAGDPSPAYAAAEDSLARALGLALGSTTAVPAAAVGLPIPGPRGPRLDEPRAAPAQPSRPAPRGADEPGAGKRRPTAPPAGADRP
jgi:predicted negative regulator of RcsB-dependent stress response